MPTAHEAKSKPEAWTIGELLDWTARFLAAKGAEFPRLDTELLLAHTLDCRRIELYTRYAEPATPEVREQFRALIRRRVEGCPVAYLIGRKEFFSLQFEVNSAVLIPRPETEYLVLECLRLARALANPRILEVGTGSGNIAVALAHQHRTAQVTTVDLSPEALAVARRNAAKHGVSERIRFVQGDLLTPIAAEERFDFVVSNPPYVADEEMARLPAGVRDFEPHLALAGGPGGYAVFERLIDQARRFLTPGGWFLAEIGATQEHELRERLAGQGYELAATLFDDAKHPRVLQARWKGNEQAPT